MVPIAGEPLAPASTYGSDRLFVRLRMHGSFAEEMRDTDVRELKAAHMPVAEIALPEPWRSARSSFAGRSRRRSRARCCTSIRSTSRTCSRPKTRRRRCSTGSQSHGRLPIAPPDRTIDDGVALTLTAEARTALAGHSPEAILTLLRPDDYFALLAYLGPDDELAEELRALRVAVRDRTRAATMFGYGPRYLHSTGQLHKGGPNTGVFVLISAQPRIDMTIPGEPFSFGTLELAQALGDFASLDATGRRALHVHLPAPDRVMVHRMAELLLERLGTQAHI